jgi:hypothetical protein
VVLPTIDDLADELNMTSTPDGVEGAVLQRHLDAAIDYVENHTRPLSAKTITVRAIPNGRYLTLPVRNVTAINSVTDPVGRTVDLTAVGAAGNIAAGVVLLPYVYLGNWYGAWALSYWTAEVVVGDDDPPADLLLAVIYIAVHFYQARRGGFLGNGPPTAGDGSSQGYAIPHRAQELINDYEMPTFA